MRNDAFTIDPPEHVGAGASVSPSRLDRIARRQLLARIADLQTGTLILREGGHEHCLGRGEPTVAVEICDPRAWSRIALGGHVGAGEAYLEGFWRSDDLVGVVRLLLKNRAILDRMERGLARLTAPLRTLYHLANRNSRSGSQRNIAAHYDLGNDFYRLWLDESMSYSCALFERPSLSLVEAQEAKLERICRTLDIRASDHLLEIGGGWGGFALHAARRYGCRITSVTLSREQYQFARARVEAAGLSDRIELMLTDYRDLEGRFDKLVSIEMIEAVGADHLDTYFRQCGRLLKAEGVMLLQGITIADRLYAAALKEVDFIQRYIFPGGFLPSITAMSAAITRASDLKVVDLIDIGPHYAETLAHWRSNVHAAAEQIRALGFDERFLRMWEYYLCYCEGGFRERDLGTVQMLIAKPDWRGRLPARP